MLVFILDEFTLTDRKKINVCKPKLVVDELCIIYSCSVKTANGYIIVCKLYVYMYYTDQLAQDYTVNLGTILQRVCQEGIIDKTMQDLHHLTIKVMKTWACFLKVPITFWARKASRQTAICLV